MADPSKLALEADPVRIVGSRRLRVEGRAALRFGVFVIVLLVVRATRFLAPGKKDRRRLTRKSPYQTSTMSVKMIDTSIEKAGLGKNVPLHDRANP